MSVSMHEPKNFRSRIQDVLATDKTPSYIAATDFLVNKRKAQFSDDAQLQQLRDVGEGIRQNALRQLPDLLEQLEKNCQANGIQVHWADDSEQANKIIHSILAENKVQQLVKGKSMVSEEIELNHYLQERGIECLESDMGEYIIQLADEAPSHIIMPAIHKTKAEIAQLFHDNIEGMEYTEDVDALIQAGRQVLRNKFEQAQAGISGVNFAVAETGTLCLVENEGNGRMSTTVPPIHIAVTGIEKVIPSLNDLPALLSLLPRSATGQNITTYVNMISGPRKKMSQADNKDGPEQVHLVLLDNGRSNMYQHPLLQASLQCIRCGACMNHCPVYARVGGHAYGTTYPGPIGQAITPQLKGLGEAGELVSGCSLNGSCGEACPVRIPLPGIIRQLRAEAVNPQPSVEDIYVRQQGALAKPLEKKVWQLWAWLNTHPKFYRFGLGVVNKLAPGLIKAFNIQLAPWSNTRSTPMPASKNFQQLLKQVDRES